MVFSSVTFLFLFLPLVLAVHFLLPTRLRNHWLLLASLFFYAWGETVYVVLMLASIGGNYLCGRWVERARVERVRSEGEGDGGSGSGSGWVVGVAVGLNLAMLAVFKYADFVLGALNQPLQALGLEPFERLSIHLPIGISFFTFQAISYLMDVHRGVVPAQRRPVHLALYIALFPQLIAGPIVRYSHVARQLLERHIDLEGFAVGVRRFVIGLGKKVLLANTFAGPADAIFALPAADLSPAVAWLGVICYTLQIYFDFSGYSDMAIGLGRMFGFHFLENFDYPYIARSVREFWRRWHISLSSWFRDYLFIPLGGSRGAARRTYFNLVLVFFLCGLWHGASWTFVVWGLYHGLFLVVERLGLGAWLSRAPRALGHVYALLVAMVGWVFFRAETFAGAAAMLASMSGWRRGDAFSHRLDLYVDSQLVVALLVGVVAAMPIARRVAARLAGWGWSPGSLAAVETLACMPVLVLSALVASAQTHDPFIYFRF